MDLSMRGEIFDVPKKTRLWLGAILGSIAHAISVSKYPEISNEQSWDGTNYSVQDSMGSRGTIAFAGETGEDIVGVFFDANSSRNPFRSEVVDYSVDRFLMGMPTHLHKLAYEEALQYVLQDYRGVVMPVITAAFWSKGDRLEASEPWQQVFENGAHLIRIQLMELSQALSEWQEAYDLSSSQVALAQSLFDRKIATPDRPITLDSRERDILLAEATSDEGIDESRASFAEIGIHF
jgi:hypothetical protein